LPKIEIGAFDRPVAKWSNKNDAPIPGSRVRREDEPEIAALVIPGLLVHRSAEREGGARDR
jgi:hypothetical protein